MKIPVQGASEFYNYKGFHSIILMGIFSHDYRFLSHDVGCQGRISDGGVWAHSNFCKRVEKWSIELSQITTITSVGGSFVEKFRGGRMYALRSGR